MAVRISASRLIASPTHRDTPSGWCIRLACATVSSLKWNTCSSDWNSLSNTFVQISTAHRLGRSIQASLFLWPARRSEDGYRLPVEHDGESRFTRATVQRHGAGESRDPAEGLDQPRML